jgi:hypothetical protein
MENLEIWRLLRKRKLQRRKAAVSNYGKIQKVSPEDKCGPIFSS